MGKNWKTNIAAVPPLANMRMGESSGDPVDDTGKYNDGSYVNNPTKGKPGAITDDADTSVGFDSASSQYATFFKANDLATNRRLAWNPVGEAYSAFVWIKYEGTEAVDGIIYGILGSYRQSTVQGWFLYIANGLLALRAGDSFDNFLVYKDVSATIWDNDWHWVGYTKAANAVSTTADAADITLWLDGVALTDPVISGNSITRGQADFTGANRGAYMSARLDSTSPDVYSSHFVGDIDEVTTFEKELTAEEVADLYGDATEADAVEPTPDPDDGGSTFRPIMRDRFMTPRTSRGVHRWIRSITRRRK